MIVFGGYGGFGQRRAFYNDVHVLSSRDDGQMEWAKAEPGGTPPRPRGDHTASLVALPHSPQSKFLLVMGGRDHSSFFKDMHVLDVGLMTWSSIPNNPAPTAPQTMCNHVALGIQSVPNYKLFVFGGQAGGAARTDWKYINSIDCMDLGRMEWMAADSSGASFVQGAFPAPREDCAFAYDRKNNRVLVHGGWADRWFRELYYLDVASIVGPPYACYSLEPAEGPMTGQTPIALRGEDFSAASSIKIQFSDGKNTEVVDGKFVSTTQLTCSSPDWTKYSPGEVSPASDSDPAPVSSDSDPVPVSLDSDVAPVSLDSDLAPIWIQPVSPAASRTCPASSRDGFATRASLPPQRRIRHSRH